jgi:hypothetical protein
MGEQMAKIGLTNLIDDILIGAIFFPLRFLVVAGPPLQTVTLVQLSKSTFN